MLVERVTLTTLLLTSAMAGLSFYRYERGRLESRFQAHGLASYKASLDGGDVHYWAGGNPTGRPLLLIHGFGGDALFGWAGQAPLAKERFIIAPDLLWFGESHGAEDDFSAVRQAEVVAQLLDHLAIPEADVVGISYGGFVLLELAQLVPERIRRAVFVDSPGHVFSLDDYHDALDRLELDSVADLVVPEDPTGVRRLMQIGYHRPPPIPMFVARDVYANMFVKWKAQKVRLLDHLLELARHVDPDAYAIPMPTLVLWGDHDALFPPALAHRLAEAIGPHARVRMIPQTNHAPNLERPIFFNQRLREFFRDGATA